MDNLIPLTEWGLNLEYPFIISGPCSAESEDQINRTAEGLAECNIQAIRAGIWKPRTRPGAFEGVGESGLKWLKTAGERLGIPVIVEVATPEHIKAGLDHGIDMFWIGARTTGNPFAVQALADALKGVDIPVFIKNPLTSDLELWIGALERIQNAGIRRLGAIHRGFSSYGEKIYRYKPEWQIPNELKMKFPDLPLVCDPSHICGRVDLIQPVCKKAMDLLFDGLMIESHIEPEKALSDAKQQVTPAELNKLLGKIMPGPTSANAESVDNEVRQLEEVLARFDEQIIELLAERISLSNELREFQPESSEMQKLEQKERELNDRIKLAKEKGLDEDITKRFINFIVSL